MVDHASQQLKLVVLCASGVLYVTVGVYAIDHPAVRQPILALSLGTAVLLGVLYYVLQATGKRLWFPLVGGLIGVAAITWLVVLSGGSSSDFWPAWLLITLSAAALLKRRELILIDVLIAAAMLGAHIWPVSTTDTYGGVIVLLRACVVLIPAELYYRLYQIKEQQRVELLDASAREKQTAEDLSRRNIELNLMNNVAMALNSTLDLDNVLTRVISLINASLGVEAGSVFLIDRDSGDLVIRTLVGQEAISVDGLHIPRGKGIAGWVYKHGETALVNDVHQDARFYAKVDELSGFRTRSMLCIPLRSKDRVIGVLEAINKRQGTFSPEDRQLLEGLAPIAGPAVENALLHTELKHVNDSLLQRYHELQETQDQLVNAEKRAAAVELAGAAAHQLNQPLTVVLCSLGLVRRALPAEHAALEDLDVIEQAVEKAAHIVQQIGSITLYKTKTYVEGIRILDLEGSSGKDTDSS